MAAFPTIEHFDVIKNIHLRFLPGIVNLSLKQRHLQLVEKASFPTSQKAYFTHHTNVRYGLATSTGRRKSLATSFTSVCLLGKSAKRFLNSASEIFLAIS
jgi:hypothetical protein